MERSVCLFLLCISMAGCWRQSSDEPTATAELTSSASPTQVEASEPNGSSSTGIPDTRIALFDKSEVAPTDEKTPQTELHTASISTPTLDNFDGPWTTQRLIVLANEGPLLIDLMVRIGQQDLEAACQSAVQPIADALLADLAAAADGTNGSEPKVTWEHLLDHPLVRSGWLGNLVAQDSQRDQVLELYDENDDKLVQPNELPSFLSRGLARVAPLQFRDAGDEGAGGSQSSAWGVLDRNSDNVLEPDEIRSVADVLRQFDFDGDADISLAELTDNNQSDSMMQRRGGNSILPTATVVAESPIGSNENSTDETKAQRQRRQKALQVVQHYSFGDAVERDQWTSWGDELWSQLDANGDGRINSREAVALFECPAHVNVGLQLPDRDSTSGRKTSEPAMEPASKPQWSIRFGPNGGLTAETTQWRASNSSSRLCGVGFDLLGTFEDDYTDAVKSILKAQLDAGLRNEQLKAAIIQQLQLSENAFEVADENGDQNLSDEEFQRVFSWLTSRQAARLVVVWRLAERPWVQLFDQDMNRCITDREVVQAADVLQSLDRNGDGQISSDELPLVVNLQIRRTDQRLAIPDIGALANNDSTTPVAGWFSAMDANSDDTLSRAEFLGTKIQFAELDANSDGFISRDEAK